MKYIFIIGILLGLGCSVTAQKKMTNEKWREFEAQKVAFITQVLDLSPEEAAVFWPLYNEMQKKIKAIDIEKYNDFKTMKEAEKLKEEDYKNAVKKGLENDSKIQSIKKEYYEKILNVIPPSKVWKISDAERKFQRHLFERLRREPFPKK